MDNFEIEQNCNTFADAVDDWTLSESLLDDKMFARLLHYFDSKQCEDSGRMHEVLIDISLYMDRFSSEQTQALCIELERLINERSSDNVRFGMADLVGRFGPPDLCWKIINRNISGTSSEFFVFCLSVFKHRVDLGAELKGNVQRLVAEVFS